MGSSLKLAFIPGTELRYDRPDRLVIRSGEVRMALDASPGVLDALVGLEGEGASERELLSRVLTAEGYPQVGAFYRHLFTLCDRKLLGHRVVYGGAAIATTIPVGGGYRLASEPVAPDDRYRFSRFAFLRRQEDRWLIESPLSQAMVVLHDWRGAALASELSSPRSARQIPAERLGIDEPTKGALFELFLLAGLLADPDADRDPRLEQWEFHDLLFHSRSRAGRHANPYGATFPFRGKADPLPALTTEPASLESVSLYRPDLAKLAATDRSFTHVLESRRSQREQGEEPISIVEVGEFLYRTARVRHLREEGAYQTTDRVYPGGGAAYELELYLAVNHCRDLESGLYHYHPGEHRLYRISPPTPEMDALLENAGRTADTAPPQILIVFAARFQRMTWKYTSMAYATILKDVGVLFQTMYLVATAMGLAVCALGGGNSDLFARAAGTDYFTEGSVGEMLLGSRPW